MSQKTRFLHKILVVSLFSIALMSFSAADSPDHEIDITYSGDDSEIWLQADSSSETTLQARLVCEEDYEVDSIWIEEIGYGEVEGSEVTDSDTISYTFERGEDEPGDYQVEGVCDDSGTTEAAEPTSFQVIEMAPEIVRPGATTPGYRGYFMGDDSEGEIYKGTPVVIDLNVEGLDRDFERSEVDIGAWFSGYSDELSTNYEISEDNEVLTVHPFVPNDIEGDKHDITVDFRFNSARDDTTFAVSSETHGQPLYITSVRVEEQKPGRNILLNEIGDIELDLYVEENYRNFGISADDFRLNEETGLFRLEPRDGSGEYTLELDTVPEIDEDDDFEAVIDFKDVLYGSNYVEVAEFNVENKVWFEGHLRNVADHPIQGEFVAYKDGERITFDTDEGYYSRMFEPGEYDFRTDFFENNVLRGGVYLQDVELSEEFDTSVRFNYYENPDGLGTEGFEPINMMSVIFGHPFDGDGSDAWIRFDPHGVEVSDVSVYECRNWNFFSQECMGQWSQIPDSEVSPDPVNYEMRFPVEPLETRYFETDRKILMSAYAAGTPAGLELDSPLEISGVSDGMAPVGEELEFSGGIVSSEGNSVRGANVTVKLMDGQEEVVSGEDVSRTDGSFSIEMDAPAEQDIYTIMIEAEDGSHEPYFAESDRMLETFVMEGLELSAVADGTRDITAGETSTLEFQLENTGQTELNGVGLDVSSDSSDFTEYVELEQESIDALESGEIVTVNVNVDIPADYFEDTPAEYPTIEVEAWAEGQEGEPVNAESSLMTAVSASTGETGENDTGTEETTTPDDGFEFDGTMTISPSEMREVTGAFIASQSALNIALGLIFVFMMVLAGALKKKDGGGRDVRRDVVPGNSHGRTGVRPPKVSPAEEEEQKEEETDGVSAGEDDEEEEIEESVDETEDTSEEVNRFADAMDDEEQVGEDSSEEEEDKEEKERSDVEEQEGKDESVDEDKDVSGAKCDICGEEFDTEAGVKLHKETAH